MLGAMTSRSYSQKYIRKIRNYTARARDEFCVAYLTDDVLGRLVHSELRSLPSLGLLGLITRSRGRRLLCVSSTHG